MSAKIVKVGSKSSCSPFTPQKKKQILYYRTTDGNFNIVEVPENVDLSKIKQVRLKLYEGHYQTCKIMEKPSFATLYTLVSNCMSEVSKEDITEIEKAIKKQLNMGIYDYTVDAAQIAGE